MIDQRIIPDIEVPPEQTNASLRKLLREAHGRERILKEAVEYCKAMATGGNISSYRDCIYGKCVKALEEIQQCNT